MFLSIISSEISRIATSFAVMESPKKFRQLLFSLKKKPLKKKSRKRSKNTFLSRITSTQHYEKGLFKNLG